MAPNSSPRLCVFLQSINLGRSYSAVRCQRGLCSRAARSGTQTSLGLSKVSAGHEDSGGCMFWTEVCRKLATALYGER